MSFGQKIMKTRCPGCQTIFRVSPEQLKARVGKVRCGQCQTVFNALDSLFEETPQPVPSPQESKKPAGEFISIAVTPPETGGRQEPSLKASSAPEVPPMSESEAQALGLATGLIMPREMTEVPGYNRWSAGVISEPFALPQEKATRWPFVLAAILLLLALGGQAAFHFRSELAVALPSARPLLASFCQLFGADIPLPRHVELVSIEASDLHNDPSRDNLLLLNATVRNRAAYAQAYPALELALTDTRDAPIARRVFLPDEYLPQRLSPVQSFAAASDIAVRLWIDAQEIGAAGYRLYVFYP